jgi:hypothetical protein
MSLEPKGTRYARDRQPTEFAEDHAAAYCSRVDRRPQKNNPEPIHASKRILLLENLAESKS